MDDKAFEQLSDRASGGEIEAVLEASRGAH